ncbi:MAG TPA: decaprenylphospho-beta-D-erythro-pentofuranosid-2-ulose 2-reductase [Acidimicrobiaceae bacterium]|nr:decaprenylphospho-beta-D-erythro-pentofuranosid-2-ulose 2-reductase [Acidimicrobiaceae bacterium]
MNDALGMPQTAVVVGATSDIARSIVRELAGRRLSKVVLTGRDEARLDAVDEEVAALGIATHTKVLDVTDVAAHSAFVKRAADALGQVDLVVMAVGALEPDGPEPPGPVETAELFATNCTGPAALLTAFAKLLCDQGQGRLLVLSSVAAVRVRRVNYPYGASKAGLDAFAQGLSMGLEGTGASVVIVRPGWVATRLTEGRAPAPFATTPDAVARDVAAALERGTSVVWSPPVLRFVFGALQFLPRALWRRLPS